MPVYEYECSYGHRSERVVQMSQIKNEPVAKMKCLFCRLMATLVPSRTGTPILKAGIGGFFKPNAR